MIDITDTTAQRGLGAGSRGWRRLLAAGAAACVVALWSSCSVEEHYELLSFFFDGVPDPNVPGAVGLEGGETTGKVGIGSAHRPFAEGRCTDCHENAGDFGITFTGYSNLDAGICLKCHETVLDQYPRNHGPVAAKDCLLCHLPHQSRYARLLRSPPPQLCLRCHELHPSGGTPPAEHADLTRSCLDCHSGHGGQERFFLLNQTTQQEADSETMEPAVEGEP